MPTNIAVLYNNEEIVRIAPTPAARVLINVNSTFTTWDPPSQFGPAAGLVIKNTNTQPGNYSFLSFADATGYGVAGMATKITDHTNHKGQLIFYTCKGDPLDPKEKYTQPRMIINEIGNVGIGTMTPNFPLEVFGATGHIARRQDDNTAWDVNSDARLKTDINPFMDGLDVIKQIHTVTYKYNGKANTDTTAHHIGVIAQDIRKVAPYAVTTYIAPMDSTDTEGTELLSFNPHGLFFALINAVKQLDSTNTNLAAKDSAKSVTIDSLKTALTSKDSAMEARMLALEARMAQCCQNSSSSGLYKMGNNNSTAITQKEVELITDEVVLDQNNPNPFKESTIINYYIPAYINYAQIIFYDNAGRIIKTVDINEQGQGQLNVKAESMSNGIYTYSIVVDGVIIDTKKMLKTR